MSGSVAKTAVQFTASTTQLEAGAQKAKAVVGQYAQHAKQQMDGIDSYRAKYANVGLFNKVNPTQGGGGLMAGFGRAAPIGVLAAAVYAGFDQLKEHAGKQMEATLEKAKQLHEKLMEMQTKRFEARMTYLDSLVGADANLLASEQEREKIARSITEQNEKLNSLRRHQDSQKVQRTDTALWDFTKGIAFDGWDKFKGQFFETERMKLARDEQNAAEQLNKTKEQQAEVEKRIKAIRDANLRTIQEQNRALQDQLATFGMSEAEKLRTLQYQRHNLTNVEKNELRRNEVLERQLKAAEEAKAQEELRKKIDETTDALEKQNRARLLDRDTAVRQELEEQGAWGDQIRRRIEALQIGDLLQQREDLMKQQGEIKPESVGGASSLGAVSSTSAEGYQALFALRADLDAKDKERDRVIVEQQKTNALLKNIEEQLRNAGLVIRAGQ